MSGGRTLHMERTNSAAALDKRQNRMLVRKASTLRHILFLTDESFIDLNNVAVPTKRYKLTAAHGFAQSMRHKPSGPIRDAESAMDLMAAHTLFACAKHVRSLQPQIKLYMAALENGSDCSSELALAMSTTLQTHASRLAADDSNSIQATAAWANWAIRP